MQSQPTIAAVAIYARVSTEDQAERQTVQAQLDFLRRYCDLHQIPIVGEYVDDGTSGTIPLDQRPEGRRLLDDAEARRFGVVLVYRLDRLGRSLKALLTAHDALDGLGVAIRSGTEPFDTASPIGRFLFNLLGSMAELERETIRERTTMGRDRVAKNGQYVGGPIPFGYDLDGQGCLKPSARPVPELGMTEAEAAADLFNRVAGGSTLFGEVNRLNALGIVPTKRYATKENIVAGLWTISRLSTMLKNPLYRGDGRLHSRYGTIEYQTPALVDAGTWERTQATLASNRRFSKKNARKDYMLRGFVRCGNCGLAYCGAAARRRDRTERRLYRCNGYSLAARPDKDWCRGKAIGADWLEELVWSECAAFARDPGPALEQAQAKLRERPERSADGEAKRRGLLRELAEKDTERQVILTMLRRKKITMDDADVQLAAIDRETGTLRGLLESLKSQEAMAAAAEAYLADAAVALAGLRSDIDAIEALPEGPEKVARKRERLAYLVQRITVTTEGEGRAKAATVALEYTWGGPDAAVDSAKPRRSPPARGRRRGRSLVPNRLCRRS